MNTLSENKEIVTLISDMMDLDVQEIQPYHLRISDPRGPNPLKRLDYFPKTGRATWVSSQRWFTIEHIDKFLEENFKSE